MDLKNFRASATPVHDRPTKSTGPWDRRSQKKIDPRRKFSKLKKKKKKNISEKKWKC